MIVFERIATLVFEEDARNAPLCKRIVVAIASQFATIELFEITVLSVDFLEEFVSALALVANLAVLYGVVVANHIEVEQIANLAEFDSRVGGKPLGAAKVGVLARESDEIDVVLGAILGIVGGKSYNGSRSRGVVVSTCIIDLATEVTQVVVVGGEHEATVVPCALNFGDDIETLIFFEEQVLDVEAYDIGIGGEVGRPKYRFIY